MKKLISLLAVLASTGCVTLTEEQRYERESTRIERSETAQIEMIDCERRGGLVRIERSVPTGRTIRSRRLGRTDTWRCIH